MSLPRFSVNNQVFVNMLMLVILAGGAMFALTLTREIFPESRPNKILISSVYPGVQPKEIEKAVTIKVEEAVRDVDGVEKIDSTVNEGLSLTALTLFSEVDDIDTVLQEVKVEVDSIQDMPDDVEATTVRKLEPRLPVISVALFGAGDEAALKRAARSLRDDLLTLPGITDVEIAGTRADEISVEVRPERLLEYNITFNDVAEAIRQTNLDVSGGELKGPRANISVRTIGEEDRGVELENIVVRTAPDGSKVYLTDVADVRDHFVESDLESWFDGARAVHCIVYKSGDEDAIQISNMVKAYVYGKRNESFDPWGTAAAAERPWYSRPLFLFAAGISRTVQTMAGRPDPLEIYKRSRDDPFDHNFKVALHTDLARFIEGRLDLMLRNGKSGLVLVLLSLVLFLNRRVALWAAVGLPVSFLGTFIVMWIFGVTLNLLSMFGLIIVLGIIVDDAIVIGENIYRHVEEGLPPREAAVRGAEEVMWPVTIAVLTTIAAFSPLLFVKGQIGDFMEQLPLVVLSALTVSLIEALIILPAHLADLPSAKTLAAKAERRRRSRLSEAWRRLTERFSFRFIQRRYEKFLRLSLRWRYVTLATACGLLMCSVGLWMGGVVEWVFIQKMDGETIIGAVEMPVGSPASVVRDRLNELTRRALQQPEVAHVEMYVAQQIDISGTGSSGNTMESHLGQLIIELESADARERAGQRSSEQILGVLRETSQNLPGVNSVTWEVLSGGPGGKDIVIQVSGPRFQEIVAAARDLKRELAGFAGVVDIDDNIDQGKREVQLRLRDSARPTGITVAKLGDFVRSAMYGNEARRITRDREDVRIMVRYPENYRENVYHLEKMWIPANPRADDFGWVPLGEVAELSEAEGYSSINRSQQFRAVKVVCDVQEGVSTNDIVADVERTFEESIRPKYSNVSIEFQGNIEEQEKAFGSLWSAFLLAMLLIYTMLAGLFRSYLQPLVVMAAIPFGAQGAIIGHWVTGYPMTILSAIGLVALTGIVVNDAIVLVDFINKRVRRGMPRFEASIEGARLRLRAIFLTSLTTIAGLTPLMFETSFQARFLIPMAVTLTWGLAFSTVLTLIIVPSLNMVFFDVHAILANAFNWKQVAHADAMPAGAAASGDSS